MMRDRDFLEIPAEQDETKKKKLQSNQVAAVLVARGRSEMVRDTSRHGNLNGIKSKIRGTKRRLTAQREKLAAKKYITA